MNRTVVGFAGAAIAGLGTTGLSLVSSITGRSPECLRAIESQLEYLIVIHCQRITDGELFLIGAVALAIGVVAYFVTSPSDISTVVDGINAVRSPNEKK